MFDTRHDKFQGCEKRDVYQNAERLKTENEQIKSKFLLNLKQCHTNLNGICNQSLAELNLEIELMKNTEECKP